MMREGASAEPEATPPLREGGGRKGGGRVKAQWRPFGEAGTAAVREATKSTTPRPAAFVNALSFSTATLEPCAQPAPGPAASTATVTLGGGGVGPHRRTVVKPAPPPVSEKGSAPHSDRVLFTS